MAFESIVAQIVEEEGSGILEDRSLCGDILKERTGERYKDETHFFLQALDAGYYKELIKPNAMDITTLLIRDFQKDYGVAKDMAEGIVYLLANLLGKQAQPSFRSQPLPVSHPKPAVLPGKTYKVGYYGPAGGVVFFDKGNNIGGWQYLEAALNDIGSIPWGLNGITLGSTDTAIGTGWQNTQSIVESLGRIGEFNAAAWLCLSYRSNRRSDWFLPSKDELDLMFRNLKQKKLGGFSEGNYWSSSEFSGGSAWEQSFSSNGLQHSLYKRLSYNVRPVRMF
jgi:hypothetical protein